MLSQRSLRFHKQKIIGGNILKNVYDKVKNVISTGSKILNRNPEIKKVLKNVASNAIKRANATTKAIESKVTKAIEPLNSTLNDRSRAILSNLIAGSGFKNYMY